MGFALPLPLQRIVLLATLIIIAGAASGCGTAVRCAGTTVVNVFPAMAIADHMSTAPGDQQQFSATTGIKYPANATGCVYSALSQKLTPTWTASDPTNVKISSAQDATNGLATCVGATKSPVTVTALGTLTAGGLVQTLSTASLTCK